MGDPWTMVVQMRCTRRHGYHAHRNPGRVFPYEQSTRPRRHVLAITEASTGQFDMPNPVAAWQNMLWFALCLSILVHLDNGEEANQYHFCQETRSGVSAHAQRASDPSIASPQAAGRGSCGHSERYRYNPSYKPFGEGGNMIHNVALALCQTAHCKIMQSQTLRPFVGPIGLVCGRVWACVGYMVRCCRGT